ARRPHVRAGDRLAHPPAGLSVTEFCDRRAAMFRNRIACITLGLLACGAVLAAEVSPSSSLKVTLRSRVPAAKDKDTFEVVRKRASIPWISPTAAATRNPPSRPNTSLL